jgi:hypothetical protein
MKKTKRSFSPGRGGNQSFLLKQVRRLKLWLFLSTTVAAISAIPIESASAASWSGWESLGGVLKSGPTAVSPCNYWSQNLNKEYVFATSPNGLIYYRYYDGTSWSSWAHIPNAGLSSVISAPAASSSGCDNGDGFINVYAVGPNGNVYRVFGNHLGWGTWENLGGAATSAPAAISSPDMQVDYVFVRGPNNNIYENFHGPGINGWSGWINLNGGSASAPAVSSWDVHGRLDVFVKGGSNQIYQKTWTKTAGWGAWTNYGGILTSAPAAISDQPNIIHTFAIGKDGMAYSLYHRYLDVSNNQWHGWNDFYGIPSGDNNPYTAVVGAASTGAQRLDVFVRGTDNQLWHIYYR